MKTKDRNDDIKNDNSKNTRFYDNKKLALELIPFLLVLTTFIIALYVYPMLPSKVPTHWNASGQVDNYSGRASVFMLPVVFLIVIVLFFVLPLMEVFKDNMLRMYKYYYAFKIFFSVFFATIFVATLLPNFGHDINVAYVVIAMIGILFIGIGYILPKLKRNYMMGIRTGWTLSSDRVWDKTHKLGGILFAITGFLTLILLFILPLEVLFYTFMILIVLVSLFLVFYSYYLYKRLDAPKDKRAL